MKTLQLGFCLTAFAAVVQGAGKCSDIPVSFTLSSTYTDPATGAAMISGILPDNGGTYVNGINGVIALIHTCNGSNGASLNPGPNRTLTYDLTHRVASDSSTPAWTGSPLTTASSFFSFANLLYRYDANSTPSFTTYLKNVAFGNGYYLGMENPVATAPVNAPEAINTPCTTSLVNVKHIPATTNPTTPESWIVWADSTPQSCNGASAQEIGALYQYGKAGSISAVNGQFSVPFYMTITRLQ